MEYLLSLMTEGVIGNLLVCQSLTLARLQESYFIIWMSNYCVINHFRKFMTGMMAYTALIRKVAAHCVVQI